MSGCARPSPVSLFHRPITTERQAAGLLVNRRPRVPDLWPREPLHLIPRLPRHRARTIWILEQLNHGAGERCWIAVRHDQARFAVDDHIRSEEHTSELQ